MSSIRANKVSPEPQESTDLKPLYLESLALVERLHRRLLDVISDEFSRSDQSEITSTQALLLFNIGESELAARELRTRGYYLGSNVSYNLKKLTETGYIRRERSLLDRRSARISLTERGREIVDLINRLFDRQLGCIDHVGGIAADDFHSMRHSLQRLDRFLTAQIAAGLSFA
jgi:DNA-binding MarR family transcriptional regulator